MTIIQRFLGRLSATTLVALLLTVLLAPGCTKECPSVEDPTETPGYTTDEWEGSTYMSLALRGTPSTDPATEEQTEDQTGGNYRVTWQGDDVIENFAVFLVSDKIDKVQCIAGPVTNNPAVEKWDPQKQELLLTPFRSAPVNKQIFAFFNIPDAYLSKLKATLGNKSTFLAEIAKPIPYAGAEGTTYGSGDAPTLEAFRPDSHIATKLVSRDASGQREKIPDLMSFAVHGRPSVPGGPRPRGRADYPTEYFDIKRMSNTKEAVDPPFFKRSDRIMSSGVKESYLPEDNITEEEVKEHGHNLVQIYTRRVLAQAVVTVDASLVEEGIATLKNMELKSVSFQVLNFEPSFYPIAQTNDGKLPGNKNTLTPLSDKNDNTKLVNFSTYPMSVTVNGEAEQFNIGSLMRDRFFRTAHIVYDEVAPTELDPSDKDYAQKLLRQTTFENKGGATVVDDETLSGATAPSQPTTFFGSCYVTETTHHWAADPSSGYKTTNTPFFAVVAFFDANELPWSDATKASTQAKINAKEQDLENELQEWRKQLKEAEDALAALPPGSDGKKEEEVANAAYDVWYNYIVKCVGEGRAKSGFFTKRFNTIIENRNKFKSGAISEAEYIATWTKRRSPREGIRDQLSDSQKEEENTYWTDTFNKDKAYLKAKNDQYAETRLELNKKINELKKRIQDKIKAFNAASEWYPKDEINKTVNIEYFTPFFYEQGINRIFYSLVDEKFYLNYHEIPSADRGGVTHTLAEGDAWLTDLKSKLPNGKNFPTVDNGAPADAAVLPPREVLPKLSQLMNGTIKEIDLSPAERRSMDFYLYGRVAPGLVQYFGGATRTEPMDLHSGYVAWYTAKNVDRVVSYPCYIRHREERIGGIDKARLMMVYYAWLNPNTQDSSNTYASPVLRNNIYHMHINGFTRMGLSAIPFVPREPEESPYYFLHGAFDPDEKVPAAGAPLNATSSTGQPASITARSYTITF